MNDANTRWSWGWGWLLVLVAAGIFLRWVALSCYQDSIDSRGPGGGITWVITAVLYGISYALLLPAYVWVISPRPLWALFLILPLLGISFALLVWYTSSGFVDRGTAWDQLPAWPHRNAAYGPSRLLGSICFTLLTVAAGTGLRLFLQRYRADDFPETY